MVLSVSGERTSTLLGCLRASKLRNFGFFQKIVRSQAVLWIHEERSDRVEEDAMSDMEMVRQLWSSVPEGWKTALVVIGIVWGMSCIGMIVLFTAAHYRDRFPRLCGWAAGEIQSTEEGGARRDQ